MIAGSRVRMHCSRCPGAQCGSSPDISLIAALDGLEMTGKRAHDTLLVSFRRDIDRIGVCSFVPGAMCIRLICIQQSMETDLISSESKAARRRQRGICQYVEEADDEANATI